MKCSPRPLCSLRSTCAARVATTTGNIVDYRILQYPSRRTPSFDVYTPREREFDAVSLINHPMVACEFDHATRRRGEWHENHRRHDSTSVNREDDKMKYVRRVSIAVLFPLSAMRTLSFLQTRSRYENNTAAEALPKKSIALHKPKAAQSLRRSNRAAVTAW